MSTFDLVLLLIIANAVQNAMVARTRVWRGDWWRPRADRLASGDRLVARPQRGVSKLLAGEGIMLIHDGKILQEHALRAGITHDELRQALREHGVASIQDVMLGVLEPDGAISVVRYDDIKPGDRPHRRIRQFAGIREGSGSRERYPPSGSRSSSGGYSPLPAPFGD